MPYFNTVLVSWSSMVLYYASLTYCFNGWYVVLPLKSLRVCVRACTLVYIL